MSRDECAAAQGRARARVREEETFLIRITGKGVTFKRHVPGWLAGRIVRWIGEADAR